MIYTSTRFDALDVQTQRILNTLAEAKDGISYDVNLTQSIAKLLCRSEALNRSEHRKTRQMILDLRKAVLPRSDIADAITAQFEMLDVTDEEELQLRTSVQTRILELLKYPHMTDRYEELLEAHPQTFEWVFCDPKKEQLP